ncbi:unnamed protein product [Phytophthora lilii]|uniref:Unnamed protein product n=1 Tax=Phytophthora lilii TaxID=2077276 RepID=A0A9W6YJ08_9STRA|nr:unnamed protein product [Phytophthora lilii]
MVQITVQQLQNEVNILKVNEAMDPDVMTRIGHGVEAILEIWRSISRRQDGFEITLIRMEHGEQNSLIASTKCSFTLTQSLLFHEFPHNFNENGELSGVAGKLLDRDIVLFSSVHFVWDDVTARMTSMMDFPFQNELLVPFLDLLGNLDDVSKVLGASMKQ